LLEEEVEPDVIWPSIAKDELEDHDIRWWQRLLRS
jgi:hypothetical protein